MPHLGGDKSKGALHTGKETGLCIWRSIPCPCRLEKRFYENWDQVVPDVFRDCTAGRLSKDQAFRNKFLKGHARKMWPRILELLKSKEPFTALMIGPSGVGKTTLMYALYSVALRRWVKECSSRELEIIRAVGWAKATTLAEQYRNWAKKDWDSETDSTKPPTIFINFIQHAINHKLTPSIFLDELDNYSATDFQKDQFQQVVDAVWTARGQVVATADQPIEVLNAKQGEALVRRITGAPNGYLIDFYTGYLHHLPRDYHNHSSPG